MFKKVGHIFLTILVFISTTGFTINKHYCGTRYYKTTVDIQVRCCKGPCKDCHNDVKFIKIKDYFQTATFDLKVIPDFFVFNTPFNSSKISEYISDPFFYIFSYISPPLKFLGNIDFLQVFRF
ncbi:MAG: hypothetical protein M0R16_10300 [Bacteroidales bacterium]|jgi:hypothetical protein|nr:hypothetical protein [Bacteroidales bacterium]